jgi:hypothetical protein
LSSTSVSLITDTRAPRLSLDNPRALALDNLCSGRPRSVGVCVSCVPHREARASQCEEGRPSSVSRPSSFDALSCCCCHQCSDEEPGEACGRGEAPRRDPGVEPAGDPGADTCPFAPAATSLPILARARCTRSCSVISVCVAMLDLGNNIQKLGTILNILFFRPLRQDAGGGRLRHAERLVCNAGIIPAGSPRRGACISLRQSAPRVLRHPVAERRLPLPLPPCEALTLARQRVHVCACADRVDGPGLCRSMSRRGLASLLVPQSLRRACAVARPAAAARASF